MARLPRRELVLQPVVGEVTRISLRFPVVSSHKYESQPGWMQRFSTTPPMGFWFLSAKATQVIVSALVYLANAVRSQSFSPSQRFDPTWTSWFYFTPHPPIGFLAFRVFPSKSAVASFDAQYSRAVGPAAAFFG